jgi:two-component system, NarL family, nitrate/nitrite response regulator NarL
MFSTDQKVRVVVADDHPLYREGVVRALVATGQIEVLAEAENGREALREIETLRPDVAVLDYKLPDLDGLQVTHAIVRDELPTRVLMLSAFTESGIVYKALQTGVMGYLPKEARREQIAAAVLSCARGDHVVPPDVAAGLVSEIRLRASNDAPLLTERERQVLKSISDGKSLPQIASELYLSVTTIKTHVRHLYEKLGVSDRAEAVAEAMRSGLIE